MLVREIMHFPVITVGMDDSLNTARTLLARHNIHHLVVRSEGKVVGVVSDRDVWTHLSPFVGREWSERQQDLETLERRVHQIMSRDPVLVSPETDAADAAALLVREGVSCLPVTDDGGKLVGIVTTKDLLAAAYGID
ncbi:MAG: CBS domain-containing protein, partial [Planctomycetes bacterium]|nr:CBS domain-containing protein [Planctomycetota bacterium]